MRQPRINLTTREPTMTSTIELTIEKLVYQGWGMGRYEGYVVFVPNTLPGDVVKASYLKKTKRWAKARCLEYIKKSPLHQSAICEKFGECGGCQLLDVPYASQLDLKTSILTDCFSSFLPEESIELKPFVESPQHTYYRNKMEFSFGTSSIDKGLTIGLKKRGDFSTVVPLSKCYLMSDTANQILHTTLNYFKTTSCQAWDTETHQGQLRHLTIKRTQHDDQYMVILSINDDLNERYESYATQLMNTSEKITSIYISINKQKADTAFSPKIHHIAGKKELTETLGNLQVKVSPLSFFQTNALLFETLYDTVINQVSFDKTMTVLDLYCGTGTIGLYLADKVKHVIGIEENQAAIDDAHLNAKNNNITNATFYCGRVKNILKFESFSPDIVIVDPPRAGMVPKALRRTAELKVPTIIYVSCNPVTLARDLVDFKTHGYSVKSVQPVDMFPNTFHMETVSVLKSN